MLYTSAGYVYFLDAKGSRRERGKNTKWLNHWLTAEKSGINDGEKYFWKKSPLRCDMSISDYYDMYKFVGKSEMINACMYRISGDGEWINETKN